MTGPSVAIDPATPAGSRSARLAIAATLLFVLLLAALHVLRPDIDPSWRFISEYALGEYGWMMNLAFFALAVGCAALFAAIRPHLRTIPGWIGAIFLLASAAGLLLAAFCQTDPVTATEAQRTLEGRLHELAAILGGNIPLAALFLAWGLGRRDPWRPVRRSLWAATALAWAGDIAFIAAMATQLPKNGGQPGPGVLIGWPGRFMMLTYCVWILVVAWNALRLGRGTEGGEIAVRAEPV